MPEEYPSTTDASTDGDRLPGMALMEEGEFALFQSMVYRESGIWLSSAKRALLTARLAHRLRALSLSSYAAYYRCVKNDLAEKTRMLDCVCTNKTDFFREPRHFDFLERVVFPELRARPVSRRTIRVWSAACSTGEEPYSLAMHLRSHFPPADGWGIEIDATDLSTRVLESASAGCWSIDKAQEIPPSYLKQFMLRGTGRREGEMKATPEIRDAIRFARLNLNGGAYPWRQPFDLIFCRNVLIYFDVATRSRVVRRLVKHLGLDGYLFLGHAENVAGLGALLRPVIPTIYRRNAATTI